MIFDVQRQASLAETLDVAARPFDFETPDAWRLAVLQHAMRALHARAGHFDIHHGGFARSGLYTGYPDAVTKAWVEHWQHHDPAMRSVGMLGLDDYTRQWRYGLLGPDWEKRYRRSDVFNEFYQPSALDVDAAGLHVRTATVRVHLHVDHDGLWTVDDDARARTFMHLLRPVIAASARAVASNAAGALSLDSLLNTLEIESAVIADDGRWVHMSRGLERTLARLDAPQDAAWREHVGALARDLLRQFARYPRSTPSATVELAGRRASLMILRDAPVGTSPMVVLRVEGIELPERCPEGLAVLQLTERQWDVARRVTVGERNQEIADALQISVHTARRHVEAIMSKLGVSSRAAVSAAVWRAVR
jgi:DNA-binding CsgD family transcriptional regulator